jgi:hypothetical protein
MGLGGAIIFSELKLPQGHFVSHLSALVDYPPWASRLFPNLMGDDAERQTIFSTTTKQCLLFGKI